MKIWVFCIVFLAVAKTALCWTKVRDERMPEELRLVNEGISHGEFVGFFLIPSISVVSDDNHWYFSNQHFLYQTTVSPLVIENCKSQL